MYSLNEEQKKALELLEAGENVFLTGDAGTGKTFLLEHYIKNNEDKNLLVCAPTGIAALNIEGTTIHRAFGLPLHPQINGYITKCPKVIEQADIIIIDEISMCRIDIFEHIIRVLDFKKLEKNKDTQLIVVGDFFQLPPVITPDDREVLIKVYPNLAEGYCFESPLWAGCNFKNIVLTQIMRQDDKEFKDNLNKARIGDNSCINYFNQCVGREVQDPVYLTAFNKEANQINRERLDELDTEEIKLKATITGEVHQSEYPTEEELVLKIGARIMCLINDSAGEYVNGSLGTVVDYKGGHLVIQFDNQKEGTLISIPEHSFEYYDYEVKEVTDSSGNAKKILEKNVRGTFSQFPVKLSYAITIHKSQGQTYDCVKIRPRTFTDGQLYVALSRGTSIDNISLDYPIKYDYLKTSQKVLKLYGVVALTEEKRIEALNLAKIIVDNMNNTVFKTLPENLQKPILDMYYVFYRR